MKKERRETLPLRKSFDGPSMAIEPTTVRPGQSGAGGGVWKGGGYKMGQQYQPETQKDVAQAQETYIRSLQQQIKIMELEIIYLKTSDGAHVEGAEESQPKAENTLENEETISKMKYELQTALARVENIKLEKGKLHDRMRYLDKQRDEEKSKLLEQISRLTGRVEHLEKESENNEIRQSSILQDLEKEGIISKDRERSIQQFSEELEIKKEEIVALTKQVDQLQSELGNKQTMISQLQEKFMQSSQHILQESVKGMRDELKDCYVRIKDYEFKEEEWKQTKEKMDNFKVSLLDEIGDLKSHLTCVKSELDGEIRTREHRTNKSSMDSQDLLMLREKEQQLRAENQRHQTQIEKLNERIKNLQEKITEENHLVTTQELKLNTQKSRIVELENMLTLSADQQNVLRKQTMIQLDKQEMYRKDFDKSNNDYNELLKKLADAEARLSEADRKVEELVDNQSRRWEEFCRMANSMKSLSADMIQQGQANKSVHRG